MTPRRHHFTPGYLPDPISYNSPLAHSAPAPPAPWTHNFSSTLWPLAMLFCLECSFPRRLHGFFSQFLQVSASVSLWSRGLTWPLYLRQHPVPLYPLSVCEDALTVICTYSAYGLSPSPTLDCKLHESREYTCSVHCLVSRPIMVSSVQLSTE